MPDYRFIQAPDVDGKGADQVTGSAAPVATGGQADYITIYALYTGEYFNAYAQCGVLKFPISYEAAMNSAIELFQRKSFSRALLSLRCRPKTSSSTARWRLIDPEAWGDKLLNEMVFILVDSSRFTPPEEELFNEAFVCE